ncbi:hypothetical protein Tco_0168801 [Tanacetum coccineum]
MDALVRRLGYWLGNVPLGNDPPGLHGSGTALENVGELTFFLGLQVTQKDDEIFLSQDKYVEEILKKFSFSTVKTTSTPWKTSQALIAAKDEIQVCAARVSYYWKAKKATEISQSSGTIPLVTDKTVIKEWEDKMERAATTASTL